MPTKELVPTTADAEARASALYGTDWDEDGTVSAHMPSAIAHKLLEARGWTAGAMGAWTSPSGERYWHTSEALQIALAAEVA